MLCLQWTWRVNCYVSIESGELIVTFTERWRRNIVTLHSQRDKTVNCPLHREMESKLLRLHLSDESKLLCPQRDGELIVMSHRVDELIVIYSQMESKLFYLTERWRVNCSVSQRDGTVNCYVHREIES